MDVVTSVPDARDEAGDGSARDQLRRPDRWLVVHRRSTMAILRDLLSDWPGRVILAFLVLVIVANIMVWGGMTSVPDAR